MLERLELPDGDRQLIATFDYYEPFQFTHQGKTWPREARPGGRKWTGSADELKPFATTLTKPRPGAKSTTGPSSWANSALFRRRHGIPHRWTTAIVREAESRGFSFAYWEFGSAFRRL